MVDTPVTRLWRHWALFAAICFLVIFFRMLPLDAGPGRLPGPDLMVCLAMAWVLRRPNYIPVLLVAAVMLLTDILFLRPLGLWTALVVLGTEFLRAREPLFREIPFTLEWLLVSVVIAAMTVGNVLILAIFAVDQPSLGLTLIQMLATQAAYPLVVAVSVWILRLRKLAPGAVDELGRKL